MWIKIEPQKSYFNVLFEKVCDKAAILETDMEAIERLTYTNIQVGAGTKTKNRQARITKHTYCS